MMNYERLYEYVLNAYEVSTDLSKYYAEKEGPGSTKAILYGHRADAFNEILTVCRTYY